MPVEEAQFSKTKPVAKMLVALATCSRSKKAEKDDIYCFPADDPAYPGEWAT